MAPLCNDLNLKWNEKARLECGHNQATKTPSGGETATLAVQGEEIGPG